MLEPALSFICLVGSEFKSWHVTDSSVTLGRSCHFSEPSFSHIYHRDDNTLLIRLQLIMCVRC